MNTICQGLNVEGLCGVNISNVGILIVLLSPYLLNGERIEFGYTSGIQ